MNEMNAARALVSIVKEICTAHDIRISSFSDDWVFCLQKGGRTTYIMGYDFGLNSATAKMICKDKTATSDLLAFHSVPHIEHKIFHSPQLAAYVPIEGNWRAMLAYFEQHKRNVVCKPNEGTGGRGVYRVRTPFELESAVLQVLSKSRSLCLSPFENILGEYRVLVLEGHVHLVYLKKRARLVGDGFSNIQQLLIKRMAEFPMSRDDMGDWQTIMEMEADLSRKPASGEEVPINWRHNLGQGAEAQLIDECDTTYKPITTLALMAANVLGIALASVDVVSTHQGLRVLEINSGIMMESLTRCLPDGRNLAYRFYEKIICSALDLK